MRVYLAIAVMVASFVFGGYLSASYVHGQYAKKALEERRVRDELSAKVRADEVARLKSEADVEYTVGVVIDEANSDPDASDISLGMRSAERLNRIR